LTVRRTALGLAHLSIFKFGSAAMDAAQLQQIADNVVSLDRDAGLAILTQTYEEWGVGTEMGFTEKANRALTISGVDDYKAPGALDKLQEVYVLIAAQLMALFRRLRVLGAFDKTADPAWAAQNFTSLVRLQKHVHYCFRVAMSGILADIDTGVDAGAADMDPEAQEKMLEARFHGQCNDPVPLTPKQKGILYVLVRDRRCVCACRTLSLTNHIARLM